MVLLHMLRAHAAAYRAIKQMPGHTPLFLPMASPAILQDHVVAHLLPLMCQASTVG